MEYGIIGMDNASKISTHSSIYLTNPKWEFLQDHNLTTLSGGQFTIM